MTDGVMDAAQWLRFAKACADNGRELVRDAQLLLEHDRFARALALGVLAREEMGKAIQAMAVVTDGVSAESSEQFGKLERNHGVKLQAGALLDWLAAPSGSASATASIEDVVRVPKKANEAKKRGFYADLSGGNVQSPSDVSAGEAREAVGEAACLAEFLLPLMSAVDVELHAEALAILGPRFSEVMTRDVEENASTPKEQLLRVWSIVELALNGRIVEELRPALKAASDLEAAP